MYAAHQRGHSVIRGDLGFNGECTFVDIVADRNVWTKTLIPSLLKFLAVGSLSPFATFRYKTEFAVERGQRVEIKVVLLKEHRSCRGKDGCHLNVRHLFETPKVYGLRIPGFWPVVAGGPIAKFVGPSA